MSEDPGTDRTCSEWSGHTASARAESVLFIAVQAVMLVCVVLVGMQLYATA